MTVKQIMTMKPNLKLRDKFSGEVFLVSEITLLLSQMVIRRDPFINEFADRFEEAERLHRKTE